MAHSVVPRDRVAAFVRELAVWLPLRRFDLLQVYRGSRDGMTAAAFHYLCDKKGPTLVLVSCKQGCQWVFGGYAGVSWDFKLHNDDELDHDRDSHGGDDDWADKVFADPDAFLFSVFGPHYQWHGPVRFPVLKADSEKALFYSWNFGPVFNGGMTVTAVFGKGCSCSLDLGARIYQDVLGNLKGHEKFDRKSLFYTARDRSVWCCAARVSFLGLPPPPPSGWHGRRRARGEYGMSQ